MPISSIGRNLLSLLFLIACIIPGYWLLQYGIHFTDEPYQILNTIDVSRSPMAPLSGVLGHIWGMHIQCFSWLPYRYLALTLEYVSIFIGWYFLWKKSGSFVLSSTICGILLLLIGLSRSVLYGWDSLTSLFTILTVISFLSFIKNTSVGSFSLLTIISVLCVAVRIPNLPVIGMIALLILIRPHQRFSLLKRFLFALGYVLVAIVLLLLVIIIIYGSISEYIALLKGNMLSSHSPLLLIQSDIYDCIALLPMTLSLYGIVKVTQWCVNKFSMVNRAWGAGILIVFWSLWLLSGMIMQSGIFKLSYLEKCWCALGIGFCAIRYIDFKEKDKLYKLVAVALLGLICVSGSNTGMWKYPALLLIPFVTAFLTKLTSIRKITYFGLLAATPLLVFEVYSLPKKAFIEAGLSETTQRIESGRAKGLYTTPERAKIVNNIESVRTILNPNTNLAVVAEGNDRFIYQYLLNVTSSYRTHDWDNSKMLDDKEYIDWVTRFISGQPVSQIVLVNRSEGGNLMKAYLDSVGVVTSSQDNLILYTIEKIGE